VEVKGGGRKISYLKAKWFHGVVSFIILAMMTGPFFESNRLTNPNFFIFLIAIICLIKVVIPKKIFRIPLFIGVIWLNFQHYYPIEEWQSFGWGRHFLEELLLETARYSLSTPFYFPQRIALCVLLFLVILLAGLLIDYNNWYIPYMFIVGFLLSLEVYLNRELILEILIVTAITFFFSLLRDWGKPKEVKTNRAFVGKGLVFLIFSLSLAVVFPTVFESSHNSLVSLSTPIRTQLNTLGFYNMIQQQGITVARRTGFSENDRHLGGPIFDNHEVAFTVFQETGHYWRVQTKSIYTGDGWEGSQDGDVHLIENLPYEISDPFFTQNNTEQPVEATVELEAGVTFIPLPYGQVLLSSRADGWQIPAGQIQHDILNNRIIHNQQSNPMTQFQISSIKSEYTPEELRNVNFPYNYTEHESQAEYLQLPSTLPVRVTELAQDLTIDADTIYDQVIAIQSYLKDSGNFRYSKTDASFTPEGRDYVDYFLFDTQVGYCDNFSTSMVVLLRSIGVPSRWVKGYTQGNRTELEDETFNQYTVLSSHAHSWVEVFFPGIGWLPFDPTPSYAYPYEPDVVDASNDPTPELEENQEIEQPTEETEVPLPDLDEEAPSQNRVEPDSESNTSFSNWFLISFKWIAIFVTIFVTIAGIILLLFVYKNFNWLRFSLYLKFWAKDFETLYKKLLKAYHSFEPRLPKEPLIEYAKRVTTLTHAKSFLVLTERYEESLYGNKKVALDDYQQLFQDAVDRLYKKEGKLKKNN